jgi:DNA repair protein RecO (recombination protein O)
MIVRTDAIVLRAIDYGETSQIVSVYTRQHGRVSVMARGSRRPKSRFGSSLQPMSYVQAVYYYKPGRDLHTLKEASHAHRLRYLAEDMARLAAGFRIVELVRGLTEPGDPNPLLFNLTIHALLHLDGSDRRALNVLPHFQLRLASLLGFAPAIERQAVEALDDGGGALSLASGAILPVVRSGEGSLPASRAALRAFAIFSRADLDTALRMRLDPAGYDETLRLIDAYLRHHVEGRYPDRADAVARQLLHPGRD